MRYNTEVIGIEYLSAFTRKSYKNYTNKGAPFTKRNVIFGYNGQGKSSLAEEVIQQLRDNGYDDEGVRFFNKDYVRRSLLVEDSDDKLRGVKISISKERVTMEKKIEDLSAQMIDLNKDKIRIRDERKRLKDYIDNILDKKRCTNTGIKVKQDKKLVPTEIYMDGCIDIDDVLRLYDNNFEKAKEIQPDVSKLRDITGDRNYQSEKDAITSFRIPKVNAVDINNDSFNKIKSILCEPYQESVVPRNDIISWIKEGLRCHDRNASECLFCSSKNISVEKIEKRLRGYEEDKRQQDTEFLQSIVNKLSDTLASLEEVTKRKDLLEDKFGKHSVDDAINFAEDEIKLRELKKRITSKIEHMDSSVALFDEEIKSVESAVVNLGRINGTLEQLKTDKISNLTKEEGKQSVLVNAAVKIALDEDQLFQKRLNELKNLEKEVLMKGEENKKIQKQVDELRSQLSSYGGFMDYLNPILSELGVGFMLAQDPSNEKLYYLKSSMENGDQLTVADISEGEKNMLALLFFYYELFDDPNQSEIKSNVKIIVIDDPISSLDDNNRTYIIEVVKSILQKEVGQVFVFTHSWDDFCDITYKYRNKKRSDCSFYEVVKDNSSRLVKIKSNILPYDKLFGEVYEISKINIKEKGLDDCQRYHSANSMRRIFEEYMKFKIKSDFSPTAKNNGKITDFYEKVTGKKMGINYKSRLASFLSFINIMSHRTERTDEEVIKNAKFLMDFIEKTDKYHYSQTLNVAGVNSRKD